MESESSDNWIGGPCRGPVEGYTWEGCLEARDRQVMEDGKRLQKYYEAREARIEQQRLAKLREWEEWQVEWREYQFHGGPKPAPLEQE